MNSIQPNDQYYRLMIESVKDYAIFMLNPEGYVMTWNEGARRFKGYEAGEIIGKHFSVFYAEADAKAGKCANVLHEAMAMGRVEDEGWRIRKDGSKFWANVIITSLTDRDGRHVGFSKVTRDLTDRKNIELQLQFAKEDLETRVTQRTNELQKAVSSRDEFISVASHELKTPLTALRLRAQMARRQLAKGMVPAVIGEQFGRFAEHIDQQVERLRKLVDDMLDVTRVQRGALSIETEETDLSELVSEVIERYTPELEKTGSVLSLEVEENIVGMWDRFRIEQVVINLLSNAGKYGGGKPVEVRVYKKADHACLSVRDFGVGISPADQGRIFERFERAVPGGEASGLGLGLYISREIISAHGGSISVTSSQGEGSEFVVRLPLKGSA